MTDWKAGMTAECIIGHEWCSLSGRPGVGPRKGERFVVREAAERYGTTFLRFAEFKGGWDAASFRPIVSRSTDTGMAVFREIIERETITAPVSTPKKERV